MDERSRQRELDNVDAGVAPQEILQRRADAARIKRDQALAELSAVLTDEQILDSYRLDMAELRRGPDLDDVDWSLP
jgi:hypothetical protein